MPRFTSQAPAPRPLLTLPEHCLTAAGVAKRCGVALTTVYSWIARGVRVKGVTARLAAVRVGWGWRVGEEALAAFLAELNGGARVELAEQRSRAKRAAVAAAREVRKMCGLPPRSEEELSADYEAARARRPAGQ